MKRNEKKVVVDFENSIKKSKNFSLAKLNHGLTLNQMQLLAYAIYSTQQNGVTEFHKADFEKKFDVDRYPTKHAKDDSEKLMDLKVSTEDLANDKFKFWNVFIGMEYNKGLFQFEWHSKMIPHILEIRDKYVLTDLTITSKFKSNFSWILYDWLKAHYGYFHKPMTKDETMNLFNVEKVNSYQNNTGLLKKKVLDVAINEINKYTEYEVYYKEEKKGRTIVGFDFHWSNGDKIYAASDKQIKELKTVIDSIFMDMINYLSLNDNINKQQAMDLIQEINDIRKVTEDTVCVTKEKADLFLKRANWILNELENLLKLDKETPYAHYNWVDK